MPYPTCTLQNVPTCSFKHFLNPRSKNDALNTHLVFLLIHLVGGMIFVAKRPPPGGRVWTYTDLGFPTDLGASWIHGASSGNPLTPFVTEFNLRTKDDPDEQNCRTFGSFFKTEGGKGGNLSVKIKWWGG